MTKELTHTINCLNVSKEQSLLYHLKGNFYPPHPNYVINRVITMFKAYWRKRINKDLLMNYLINKFVSKDGFYRYQFNEYL